MTASPPRRLEANRTGSGTTDHAMPCRRFLGPPHHHAPRHTPPHPIGGFAPTGTASEGIRIARFQMAPTWPDRGLTPSRFSDFPFGNSPETGQPALTQKCSQLRPHSPRFSPVSGSKQPQTSLLGTDANPCTRVKHQNRPQRRLRRVPDGLTRPLVTSHSPRRSLAPMRLRCG